VNDDSLWHQRTQRQLLSRRRFLQLATLAAGGALLSACRGEEGADPTPVPTPTPAEDVLVAEVEGYDDPSVWQGRTLTVTSWGGEYQAAQERAIFEPFQRLTGAVIETAQSDIPALRRQVTAGEIRWDVCDVLLDDVLPLANVGAVEPLDYNVIQSLGIYPDVRLDHGVGSSYFSTVLAYRTDRWPEAAPPAGWQDFWNQETYPGTRGLHRDPQSTLEFALLSDGVELDDLYPLDVERALARLESIVPNMVLWWEQGAQPTQMMSTGDLDMVGAWNSRVDRIRQDGALVEIQWNGGALSGDAWVIPRDAPNRDVAMDFINFATRPEVMAAFATLVPFGPVNRFAFDLLTTEAAARLPSYPGHKQQQFTVNFEWWFRHREAVQERFNDWYTEFTGG
jgi:putative spermidine/putrescine transport system substrate-binding protein